MNIVEQIRALEGGINTLELEEKITHLIDYISLIENEMSWGEGIEWINDLIYLKQHDHSKLSEKICIKILNWIEKNYDQDLFKDFSGSFDEGEPEKKQIVQTLKLTLNTLFVLQEGVNIIPFLESRLKSANNDFEIFELKEHLEFTKMVKSPSELLLDDKLLDKVLKRANQYFLNNAEMSIDKELLCVLRETIKEHELSYSICCCLKEEQYLSPVKRTVFIGSGALFLSKDTELIAFSGSDPFTDWVEWFELKIKQQEIYWILEVDYKPKKIATLKSLLNKNTPELLKLVTEEKKIILEDELWSLERTKKDLDKGEVECRIIKKIRAKNATK